MTANFKMTKKQKETCDNEMRNGASGLAITDLDQVSIIFPLGQTGPNFTFFSVQNHSCLFSSLSGERVKELILRPDWRQVLLTPFAVTLTM